MLRRRLRACARHSVTMSKQKHLTRTRRTQARRRRKYPRGVFPIDGLCEVMNLHAWDEDDLYDVCTDAPDLWDPPIEYPGQDKDQPVPEPLLVPESALSRPDPGLSPTSPDPTKTGVESLFSPFTSLP